LQRYKIVNGVAEAEGVTNETTAEAEGSNYKPTPYKFI
jgi:hypothetical protein